jgi:SAM-dependent methyltransferase
MGEEQPEKKLNLGCGEHHKEGYVNLDWQPLTKPDVAHNLNSVPYPFSDDTFDLVEAYHVLEHLDKPFDVMKELHRILKPGGTLHIKVPHFSRGFTHAEHAHGFDVTFPYYFNKEFTTSGYYGVEFALARMELHWMAFFHLLPYMGYGKTTTAILRGMNTALSWLANLSPAFCSRVWCYWVGGFEEIEFVFACKKHESSGNSK